MKKIKRKVSVIVVSLIFSYVTVFGLAEVGFYFYIKEKLVNYSKEILIRSESLIYQIKLLDNQKDEFLLYDACSKAHLNVLRERLWPYPLIKDIAYVNNEKIYCSAMWGEMDNPLAMNAFKNKFMRDGYTWIFDAQIGRNIVVDILYTDHFAITVSPFAFRRFWDDAEKMHFSAVVGDYSHDNHFFKIGSNVTDLEEFEHHGSRTLTYIMVKSCNGESDLCVTAGAQFFILKYKNYYFLAFLILIGAINTLLSIALINNILENKKTLAARLESAILNDELTLVYQPIHRVWDGGVAGVEALLRWKDEKLGRIGPDIFIPLAEKHGLIDKISLYVVKRAIRECRDVLHDGHHFLSINVSCSDVCSSKFKNVLINTLKKENVSPDTIVLEITERQSANIEELQHAIADYQKVGVLFALDDFGTGHSNLNWLTLLDVDEIKVDKSITDTINTQSLNRHILPGLVRMFEDIPKIIVFEGVENEAQYHFLKENLPDAYVQGWYFSKALDLSQLKIYLSQINTVS